MRVDMHVLCHRCITSIAFFPWSTSSQSFNAKQTELTFIEEGADHDAKGDEGDVIDDEEDQDERGVGGVEDTPILPHTHEQAHQVENRGQE